jgi:hypothetical protein
MEERVSGSVMARVPSEYWTVRWMRMAGTIGTSCRIVSFCSIPKQQN